jgi:DNA polymerase (family 10)
MENSTIVEKLEWASKILELHGANEFKVRAYASLGFQLEKVDYPLYGLTKEALIEKGISKGMAEKLVELTTNGQIEEIETLIAQTPSGVMDMLGINGIGPKKVRALWQEMGIESLDRLASACKTGQVAQLKGFGEKTQQAILEQIQFIRKNTGKLHFANAEPLAEAIHNFLAPHFAQVAIGGEVRRCLEVVETILLLVSSPDITAVNQLMQQADEVVWHESLSGPFVWRGAFKDSGVLLEIHAVESDYFANQWFLKSASPTHYHGLTIEGQPLRQVLRSRPFSDEKAIYQESGKPFVPAVLREGTFEWEFSALDQLVEMHHLKGILHNHSTYSDGKHSLREMALHCRELGYEYLGITDHSQVAVYANGLDKAAVQKQHEEIDALNEELAPFRIFKGIEADILTDGRLDYDEATLQSFDFVIASVHSSLKMTEEKATERILKAIANPYTTMLGHPTGRLLLRREGYPLDMVAVIEACALHGVAIEINAHPWRLDLDWRWVRLALNKGIKISINPDAHEKAGYQDMRYGLLVGRKGGLTPAETLNALGREEIAAYFQKRKALKMG